MLLATSSLDGGRGAGVGGREGAEADARGVRPLRLSQLFGKEGDGRRGCTAAAAAASPDGDGRRGGSDDNDAAASSARSSWASLLAAEEMWLTSPCAAANDGGFGNVAGVGGWGGNDGGGGGGADGPRSAGAWGGAAKGGGGGRSLGSPRRVSLADDDYVRFDLRRLARLDAARGKRRARRSARPKGERA